MLPVDLFVLGLIVAGLVVLLVAQITRGKKRGVAADSDAWDAAKRGEDDATMRILLRVGQPLAGIPAVKSESLSSSYESLQRKLIAGRSFGGSVEVYLATQFGAILVATVSILAGLAMGLGGLPLGIVVLLAAIVAYYPYDRLQRRVKKKSQAVDRELADFAEVLVMPITAGMTVLQSIEFVAQEADGYVAEEARWLVQAIYGRTVAEDDAFKQAAVRLGTQSARDLFEALRQAHKSGNRVRETLQSQADLLRNVEYQNQREANKKIPVKLVFIFGLHLLPLMLIVALVPVLLSLANL